LRAVYFEIQLQTTQRLDLKPELLLCGFTVVVLFFSFFLRSQKSSKSVYLLSLKEWHKNKESTNYDLLTNERHTKTDQKCRDQN